MKETRLMGWKVTNNVLPDVKASAINQSLYNLYVADAYVAETSVPSASSLSPFYNM